MGAGIGGLAAAIQLVHQGYSVTVVEKNETAGGKIGVLHRDGFTFHTGASFIMHPEVFRDFFTSVGEDIEQYIQMKPMGDTTTFHFANDKQFTLASDQGLVRKRIAEQFPDDLKGYDRFMKIGKELNDLLYEGPKLARRNYHKFGGWDFLLNKDVIFNAHKLQLHRSWEQLVNSCFKSEELRLIFSYQSTFVGLPPTESLGTYAFLPWSEIAQGMYQVKGGVYGIIQGFYKLARDRGVSFLFNSEVTALEYEDELVCAVQTTNGKLIADLFVSNIDGAYFYSHLMPAEKNVTFTEEKLHHMKHTNSYFTINIGLKKPLPQLSHHTFFVAKNWQESFQLMFTPNSVPKFNADNTCYYALQRSDLEPSLAPKGKAVLFLLFPVCGYDPEMDWDAYESTFKEFIYDLMEERDGIQVRKHIEIEEVYSPARWGREYNLWQNVILSFAPTFFQANNFRMPNKSREFTNLYFVGSSTVPGPGVPTRISSGELVAERIAQDAQMSRG